MADEEFVIPGLSNIEKKEQEKKIQSGRLRKFLEENPNLDKTWSDASELFEIDGNGRLRQKKELDREKFEEFAAKIYGSIPVILNGANIPVPKNIEEAGRMALELYLTSKTIEEESRDSAIVLKGVEDELNEDEMDKFRAYRIRTNSENKLPTKEEEDEFVRELVEERKAVGTTIPVEAEVIDSDEPDETREEEEDDVVIDGVWRVLPDDSRQEADAEKGVWYEGVIDDLRLATDKIVSPQEREEAIERLKEKGVKLPPITLDQEDTHASKETEGNKNRLKIAMAVDFLEGTDDDRNLWSSKDVALRYLQDELGIKVQNARSVDEEVLPNQPEPAIPAIVPENQDVRASNFDQEISDISGLTDPRDRVEALSSMRRDLLRKKPSGWAEKVQRLRELEDQEGDLNPKRDDSSKEVEVKSGEDWMLLRGSMIEVISNANINSEVDGVLDRVRTNFLAKKKTIFGVLPPEVEAIARVEIRARLELKQASLFWNRMKDDKNPEADAYGAMKSGLSNIPLLSESTYRWLMEEGKNTSYISRNSLGQPERTNCENLRQELDIALGKIYEHITNDKSGGDLWKVMTFDQRLALFKKLGINNFDVASLAFQLAEAECWTAMRVGSYHPARKLAYFSDYRIERFSKNLSVPGGLRLVQEYQDTHQGRLPYELDAEGKVLGISANGVFDEEGVSLARLGLDMAPNLRKAVDDSSYLKHLRSIYDGEDEDSKNVRESQNNIRLDLSYGSMVFDAFDALGKPPVGIDALGKLKGTLFAWYIQRYGGNFGSGVSTLMLSYCKTYLWGNSVANNTRNLDAGKISDLNKFYTETFLPLIDANDPSTGSGTYVGIKPIVETNISEDRSEKLGKYPLSGVTNHSQSNRVVLNEVQQVENLAFWFYSLLFDKCYPIVESARLDNSVQATRERMSGHTLPDLPRHLIRADRNQATLVKIKSESVGFKEALKVRLRGIAVDRSKWWNRRGR